MSIFAMCCQHYLDNGERSLSVQQALHVHMHTCIKEQKRENDRTGSISRLVKFAFKILSKKKEHTQIHTRMRDYTGYCLIAGELWCQTNLL